MYLIQANTSDGNVWLQRVTESWFDINRLLKLLKRRARRQGVELSDYAVIYTLEPGTISRHGRPLVYQYHSWDEVKV